MFDVSIAANRFARHYLGRLLADWDDDQLDYQPFPGLHSPRWILAHLAIALDYGLMQLDQPGVCPAGWHASYGPKTQAGSADLKPSKDEMLSIIESGYSRLCMLLETANLEALRVPHTVALLSDTPLKSKADLAGHILTTHFATHLGQLSTLRRHTGKPPLF